MKIYQSVLLFAFLATLFFSCSDDVNYQNDYEVDIATVINPAEKDSFLLQLDDSTLLWTAESAFSNYKPTDGQRVVVNYTILGEKKTSGNYDYDVRINDLYEVLTKGIFHVSSDTQDSIGNDSIVISQLWIGSKYLNIEFLYQGYDKRHFINLVVDSLKTYTDGKKHLEFRHNANDDLPVYNYWGLVSFDISEMQETGKDSVQLVLHVNEPDKATDRTYSFTYHYNQPVSQIKNHFYGIKKQNMALIKPE